MTRRTQALAAAALLALLPAAAPASEDAFEPCRVAGPRTPRVVIAFVRASGIFGGGGCKASVHPARKKVCAGDTVRWTVVNACDATSFESILLPDLDQVTAAPCSAVTVDVKANAVTEIACTLKRDIEVKAKYSVATGTRANHRVLVDPELDIRR